MADKRLKELPSVEPRESEYSLEWIIGKLSYLNTPDAYDFGEQDLMEVILRLANELSTMNSRLKLVESKLNMADGYNKFKDD